MDKDVLDGIAVFLAVAEHRSFTTAGARLAVSPTAVSKTIRLLERRHGVPLFQRTTRRVALTEAGQRLYSRLQPAVEEIGGALEDLRSLRQHASGTLRLTLSRASCALLVEPVLARFRQLHPDVQLELTIDEAAVDLVQGSFDAGIRLGETLSRDMVALRLTPDVRWHLVGSPAYLARAGRPQVVQDLVHHQGLVYRFQTSGLLHRWEFVAGGHPLRVDIPSPLTVNDRSTLVALARQGLGLAYVAAFELGDALATGALVVVLPDCTPASDGLYLYFPRRMQSQAKLRAFIDVLQNPSAAEVGR